MPSVNLIPYAIPVFLLMILIEITWGVFRGNNTYRFNDAINSLSLGTISTATKLVFLNIGYLVFSGVEAHWAWFKLSMNSLWAWLFALFIYDFLYYWYHRISHERQIFWASHVVHHQSEDYNLSTALRQTSTSFLHTWIFFVPCFFLGMPIEMYVTIASAHLLYQFWIHTRHIPKLGFFEWFMVTPSNHRVHHAQNPRYIDKNYGGLLIVWDRLFGTFIEEDETEEVVYGVSTPLASWNPFWGNLHIWVQMATDAWRSNVAREKWTIWLSRTGYRPNDVIAKYPHTKSDLDNFEKYDPALPTWTVVAIFAHFLLIAGIDIWFNWNSAEMPYLMQAGYVGLLLYTLVALGVVLDKNQAAVNWEKLRWVLVAAGLATTFYMGLLSANQWGAGMSYLLVSGIVMFFATKNISKKSTAATAIS
jgi:alkylglycerol monooxygenase